MAVRPDQILDLNPWWRNPAAIEGDPKIQVLKTRELRWEPPVLGAMDLGTRRIHTLRGPRQVGKSTSVKLVIRKLLAGGERRILYMAFDLSRDKDDIVDAVERARALHPSPEGPWYLFLDEVTTVPDWQLGVKFLVDNGPAHEDFILCTGSSARLVGSEQLPGRKGPGKHYLQLPVSFRDYCTDVCGVDLPPKTLSPSDMLTPEGSRALRELNLAARDLARAWHAYQEIGGFPAAIEDHLRSGHVGEPTIEMLWDIVAGDVRDLGRDAVATMKLVERVNRSLGTPISWRSLAEDMDVSQPTAKEYIRLLAESFMLLTIYFWDLSGRGTSPMKQRKVYFIDPLLGAVPRRLIPGARSGGADGARENLIAVGLFRSATQRLVQAEPAPGSIGFWKSGRGTEIDFLTAEEAEGVRGGRLPIEVKGDSRTAIGNARKSIGAAFGRGLIVTESTLDLDSPIPAIPAPVFLAVLRERVERRPSAL